MSARCCLIATLLAMASPVAGQRGFTPAPISPPPSLPASGSNSIGDRSCTIPEPACPYDTDILADMRKLGDGNLISWKPYEGYDPLTLRKKNQNLRVTPAGRYTFRFIASNKCTQKEASTTIDIRCPPKPTAVATISNSRVLYGTKATLDASKSSAFDPATPLYYEWYAMSVPRDSPIKVSDVPLGIGKTYTTQALTVGGAYKFKVLVSDGCSTNEYPVCFTVECNCPPTANAGATSTVWTNTPTVFNNGITNTGGNDNAKGMQYYLDGSFSFDFDRDSLTYDWDFVSWRSLDPVGFTWEPKTFQPSTSTAYGYKTDCTKTGGGGQNFVRTCLFWKLGRQRPNIQTKTAEQEDGAANRNETTPRSNAIGYPRTVPSYNATTNSVGTPSPTLAQQSLDLMYKGYGTWYQATILKQSYVNTITRQYTYNESACTAADEPNTEYCKITITQAPAGQFVQMTRQNPLATLTVSNFKQCRGLWQFRLTVKDICGTVTQSTDTITVTVRCNEPPVAIACCNDTQVWQGAAFQQVRLDGRSSGDGDLANQDSRKGFRGVLTESLTYRWTFESAPEAHCPQGHRACTESYCTNNNYFTNVNNGQSTFGGVNQTCSPTVYPIFYDIQSPLAGNPPGCRSPRAGGGGNVCSYKAVDPTQYHVGNSAYFTPTKKGNYVVKLEVDDGCSTSTDTVIITAVCPELRVSMTLSSSSGVKNGKAAVTVDAVGVVDAYAGNAGGLTYSWSAIDSTNKAAAGNFIGGTTTKPKATFNAAGTFVITFSVTDNCQTATATSTYIVRCNTAPSIPALTITQPANTQNGATVFFAGTVFPTVRVSAASTDSDPLTYAFTVQSDTTVGSNVQGETVQFTPQNLVLLNTFSFDPAVAIGKYNLSSNSYTISATASDGCTTTTSGRATVRVGCQGTLLARPGTEKTVNYDHNIKRFPDITLDGGTSSWANAGTNRVYRWSGAYTSNSANSGALQVDQSTGNGWSSQILSFRPVQVGAYRMSLTITDGCTFNSRSVLIQATCAIAATAAATITSDKTVIASGSTVEWNSFLTSNTAGFPELRLDGTKSVGAPNDQILYTWGYQGTTPKKGLSSLSGAIVRFTLPGEGTHAITLSVRNGVCPSDTTTVTIIGKCASINALLRNMPGTSIGKSATVYVDFDGTKFPRATLDGLATTYTTVSSGTSANFERLSYTWHMLKSPVSSFYEASVLSNTIPQRAVQTNLDDQILKQNSTERSGIKYTCTDRRKTRKSVSSTIFYETVVTLANKHYNRPHTCFVPDRPGTYEVRLTVADGCTSSQATATILARCRQPPVVAIPRTVGTFFSLNTSAVTRVTLPSVVTPGPDTPASSLTFQWDVVSAPGASMHKPLKSCTITNDKSSTASVVVDAAGSYTFRISVSDGCNEPVTQSLSFTAGCNEDITLQRVTVTPESVNWTSVKNDLTFVLKSGASSFCGTPSFRWVLQSRACVSPYTKPRPAPPTASCKALDFTCAWSVVDTPCKTLSVNPRYKEPKIENPDKCKGARFIPRHSGTYTLQLSVSDTCGTSTDTMTVVARCASNIQAVLTLPGRSFHQCNIQAKRYMYNRVYLNATARLGQPGPNNAIHSCPVKSVATKCDDKIRKECCAAPKCCADSDMSQCAECPMCPMCPSCHAELIKPCSEVASDLGLRVTTTKCKSADGTIVDYASGAGAVPAPAQSQSVSLRRALAATMAVSSDGSSDFFMSTLAPIGVFAVISMIGNLLMMVELKKSPEHAAKNLDTR